MNDAWIIRAITAGGTLSVKAVIPGKSIMRARMDWPGEDPIIGGVSLSVEDALGKLDLLLLEDCARERQENGDV